MFKRWVIRGVLVGLVALSLGGWAWSTMYWAMLAYSNGRYDANVSTGRGIVSVYCQKSHATSVKGFTFVSDRQGGVFLLPRDGTGIHNGFQWASNHPDMPDLWYREFVVPYWFIICVLAVVTLIGWRRTRGKGDAARAFPVEVKGGVV